MADNAQWFRALGSCQNCGRVAHGNVMSSRNEILGAYCSKCGQARVKKATAERERELSLQHGVHRAE